MELSLETFSSIVCCSDQSPFKLNRPGGFTHGKVNMREAQYSVPSTKTPFTSFKYRLAVNSRMLPEHIISLVITLRPSAETSSFTYLFLSNPTNIWINTYLKLRVKQ